MLQCSSNKKGGNCDALQLKGHLMSHQSLFSALITMPIMHQSRYGLWNFNTISQAWNGPKFDCDYQLQSTLCRPHLVSKQSNVYKTYLNSSRTDNWPKFAIMWSTQLREPLSHGNVLSAFSGSSWVFGSKMLFFARFRYFCLATYVAAKLHLSNHSITTKSYVWTVEFCRRTVC